MEIEKIYLSQFEGEEIDYAIECIQNMHPQIIVIGGSEGTGITCTGTNEEQFKENKELDSSNKCIFDIPYYDTYTLSYTNDETEIETVYVDIFKKYTVSIS